MTASQNAYETPSQLEDALARIEQAKENYISLTSEINEFLYNYVKGMVKGLDPETGDLVLQLRDSKDSNVRGKPVVLVSQILENLRTALDYMVFQLSVLNKSELNEREPQFVIADSESKFESQAKTCLRHLTDEQKDFVQQIQPYHGNWLLALLGEITAQVKHRRLLSIRNITGLQIYASEITKQEEYKDCFVYPFEDGQAIFARPKSKPVFLLIEKYDAMLFLKAMIEHVEDILQVSYCFFQGRPLEFTVLKG